MPFVGEFSALLTAVLWAGTSLAFNAAILRVGSVQVNITRLMLATVFLFVTISLFGYPIHPTASQTIYLVVSGIAGLVLGDSFLFKAFQHVGPRIGMLMMALAPALTAILAYLFLDEGLSLGGLVGMIVTLLGVSMVVLERKRDGFAAHPLKNIGILYGFLAAAGQATGLILAKKAFLEVELNEMVATFMRLAASVVVLLPIGIAARWYRNPFRLFARERRAFAFTTLGALLGPYLGITLSFVAITHTKVGIAATLMATVPIIMLPMVKLIHKERLSWKSVIGAVVAVGGVAILFSR